MLSGEDMKRLHRWADRDDVNAVAFLIVCGIVILVLSLDGVH